MRYKFGGDGNSILITQAIDHDAYLDVSGVTGTVWYDESKTQRVLDLSADASGARPIQVVTASTSDGRFAFYGPDGWMLPLVVDFGAGPFWIYSPAAIADAMTALGTVNANVAASSQAAAAAQSAASQAQSAVAALGQTAGMPDGGKHVFTRATDPAGDPSAGVVNGDVWIT